MIIAFSRYIGPVALDCLISERHLTEVEITGNPIETGAEVNDHAYVKPKVVTLEIANKNAQATFAALVAFQETRVPFTLVTGLFVYKNMLIKTIDATRDKTFARILSARVELREVIIVSTATAPADDSYSGKDGKDGRSGSTSKEKAGGDGKTADRASGSVQSGDAAAKSVPASSGGSILKQAF